MIYHIIEISEYIKVKKQQIYHPTSIDQEGFIHCSGNKRDTIDIANSFFQNKDIFVFEIDDEKLTAITKWEKVAADSADRLFPHIYGELETKYIVGTKILMKDVHGHYIDWKTIE